MAGKKRSAATRRRSPEPGAGAAELPGGGHSGIAAADDNKRSEIRKAVSDRLRTPIRLPDSAHAWTGSILRVFAHHVHGCHHGDRLRSGAQSETLAPPRFGAAA